jgi:hypothetical protein
MSVLSVTVINAVRVGFPRKIITRIMVLDLPLLVLSLLEYQVSDLLVKSWLESPDRELLVLLEYPGREKQYYGGWNVQAENYNTTVAGMTRQRIIMPYDTTVAGISTHRITIFGGWNIQLWT